MVVRRLIERTVYVAECPKCGDRDVKEDRAPRERLCACGQWVDYKEQTATGPDLGLKGYQ